MSILLDYVPEEANQEDEAFCYQQVDGTLGIYYLDRSAVPPLSPVNYLYRYIPQLLRARCGFPAMGGQGRLTRRRWKSPGYWHSSGRRWN
ncbi:MAG: hypothetical protein ACLTQL_00595 [Eisenbergiella sp.]